MTDEPIRRQRRKVLTDKMVAELKRKRKRYILADPEQRGHYLRVPSQGPVVYAAVARYGGRQVWATLGTTADLPGIEQARDEAREAIRRIKDGLSAFEPPPVRPDSVADVAEGWRKRHVEANGLRSTDELKRVLEKHVLPVWRDRAFAEIKRSDVADLLDQVEDAHGHWTADVVLSVLRSLSTWFAKRNDGYTPPFVRGMRRTPKQARERTRILNDAELAAVWSTAQEAGGFGAFLQVLLLTAQRREKVATMKWKDLDGEVWAIASAPREKGNPGSLRLPPLAMTIIEQQPHIAGNPYVFAGRGKGPMVGFSKRHAAFKKACKVERTRNGAQVIEQIDDWTLHDLRRTARSLLSRTSTRPDISERVLGHSVGSTVAQTYDRHDYRDELADALLRLAVLIDSLVHPGDNVVALQRAQP